MAMNITPTFPESVNNAILEIENADGTTTQDLIAGGEDGTKITQILASSSDTADKDLFIYKTDGTAVMPLGRITIPDGSGLNGTDGFVDLLSELELASIWLEDATWKIQIAAQAAVTAATTIWVSAEAQDY